MKTQTCRTLACTALSLGIPLLAFANDHSSSEDAAAQLNSSSRKISSPLVDKVRRATGRFRDINVAIGEDWVQGTPCVSGPNEGAMGVHFVLPDRIGDGVLDADEPEALIYEPLSNGAFRLVGVEFIVLANTWTGDPGADAGRSLAELCRRTEPLRPASVLRTARLGVGAQSERKLRGLEHACYVRQAGARLRRGRRIRPASLRSQLAFGNWSRTRQQARIASNCRTLLSTASTSCRQACCRRPVASGSEAG